MADYKYLYPIEKMSKVFGVSRSGYYRWLTRPPSLRALENQKLKKQTLEIWYNRKRWHSGLGYRTLAEVEI